MKMMMLALAASTLMFFSGCAHEDDAMMKMESAEMGAMEESVLQQDGDAKMENDMDDRMDEGMEKSMKTTNMNQ